MSTAARTRLNPEEYLDGEMFLMAGTSRTHSLIATNLIRELGNGRAACYAVH